MMARSMENATPDVRTAFKHVKEYLPSISAVTFDLRDMVWMYMFEDGTAPNFGGLPIDQDILNKGLESVEEEPTNFLCFYENNR